MVNKLGGKVEIRKEYVKIDKIASFHNSWNFFQISFIVSTKLSCVELYIYI